MLTKVYLIISRLILRTSIQRKIKKSNPTNISFRFKSVNLDFITDDIWEKIEGDADRLCCGNYQIFNYPVYNNIQWNMDPVTGKKNKSKIDKRINKDIKII